MSAMTSLQSLSSNFSLENSSFNEKVKRQNIFLIKSIVRWINSLQNVKNMIDHRRTYEDVILMTKQLGKEI